MRENRIHDVSLRAGSSNVMKEAWATYWKGQAAHMHIKSAGKCRCHPHGSWGSIRVDVPLPLAKMITNLTISTEINMKQGVIVACYFYCMTVIPHLTAF